MSVTQRDLVRDIVTEVAPHELTLLDGFASLDDAAVTRVLSRRRTPDDPVGFGVADAAALVVPVVWLVVDHVVRRGAEQAADGLLTKAKALLRRLLRRPAAASRGVPPLTREQLGQVHALVVERAAAAGVDDTLGARLADAVVSRLARHSPSTSQPDPEQGAAAAG